MSTLKDLRNVRLEKLTALKKLGVDPYPANSSRTNIISDINTKFDTFESTSVVLTGRVTSIREHGQLVFMDVSDATGKIQFYLRADALQNADYSKSELTFEELSLLDVGDYVEGAGTVLKTTRGEISLDIVVLRILTKTLRPLPDSWDGLKDKEIRLRRRYLDTKLNKDVYERFVRRAKFWEAHRRFFATKGFLEMNIPVLETTPGGADAKPFVTHMEAIDQDFYLRISQELYLKRLIGGGYEKVFEIGPRFRNEGLSDEHLPEHMAMEFYWAYADWESGMQFVEELFKFVLNEVYDGQRQLTIRGFNVDFSKDWEKIDFAAIMREHYDLDVFNTTVAELKTLAKKHGVLGKIVNVPRGVDLLWKSIRSTIAGPAFLVNHPKYLAPLSKAQPTDANIVQKFQPIIAGSELGNGWSEINDPQDQLARFKEQQALRAAGDEEAQWLDIDYVEMLEYGMPPTFGYGHSERVFWFLEDISAREGVPFPQLKFELDETTKDIYGL